MQRGSLQPWEAPWEQSSSGEKPSDTHGACLESRKVDRLHRTATAKLLNAPVLSLLSVVRQGSILVINLLKLSTRLGERTHIPRGGAGGARKAEESSSACHGGASEATTAHKTRSRSFPPSASSTQQPGLLRFRQGASLPTLARQHPSPLVKYFLWL